MHISSLEEYGLRTILQLARRAEPAPEGFPTQPISAAKIAEREKISTEYVSKLMFMFRQSGLVKASRGIKGGFYLSKSPSEITLKEVLDGVASQKQNHSDFCQNYSGNSDSCVHVNECSVRPVWMTINGYFNDLLKQLTLQDLLQKETDMRKKVSFLAKSESEHITSFFKKEGAQN